MCHQALQDRIKDVMVQWSSVKVSGYNFRFAFVPYGLVNGASWVAGMGLSEWMFMRS